MNGGDGLKQLIAAENMHWAAYGFSKRRKARAGLILADVPECFEHDFD
jgi:hypothetical protein